MSPVSSFEQAGIPCLDLTPFREGTDPLGVAKAFGAALEEVGFVVITGHGIPEAIIQTAYERARAFFDLPLEQKMEVVTPDRVKNHPHPGGIFCAKPSPACCRQPEHFTKSLGLKP